MALNIKNTGVVRLAAEVAAMAGESKTEAIRKALEERKARLCLQVVAGRKERLTKFLEREVWPNIPRRQKGKRLTRAEEDRVLGYGPEGV